MTASGFPVIPALIALLTPAVPIPGQSTHAPPAEVAIPTSVARSYGFWEASGVLLTASLVFDERLRSVALANHTPALDRLAGGADILGTAGHIVPALVGTYVGARLLGKRSFAAATLRVGLSYAAADAVESLLKPAVGRDRPYTGREPLTFRPFSLDGDHHSFPSAHVVHISSLATAIATESHRPLVTALAAVTTCYVGAQRVYRDQHWSSDVVASGMLGVEVSEMVMTWLRSRRPTTRP
jgi:membrane-associated phospholipid phosphatase